MLLRRGRNIIYFPYLYYNNSLLTKILQSKHFFCSKKNVPTPKCIPGGSNTLKWNL